MMWIVVRIADLVKVSGPHAEEPTIQAGERIEEVALGCYWRDGFGWADMPTDASLHAKIDFEAGEFRKRFITDIPGQQLTYDRKEREARAFVAEAQPSAGDFPFLAAEAQTTEQTLTEVAQSVIANANMWALLGAAIEGRRIGAKRAVTLAETLEAKIAAANVDWEELLP
jgi:hypothetical protein